MPIIAGENFEQVNSEKIRTTGKLKKEGYLLLLDYEKGDETNLSLKINMYIDNQETVEDNEYVLTETDSNGNIILWQRNLTSDLKTIYPFRLPGRCTVFDVIAVFSGGGTLGRITIDGKSNTFYYNA